MVSIVIDISTTELLIWTIEIIILVLLIMLIEYFIFKRKDIQVVFLLRTILASLLIVILVPLIGLVSRAIEYEGRDFFPIGVVIVYTLTYYILYLLIHNKQYNRAIPLTTILLCILYIIRQIFNVSFIV